MVNIVNNRGELAGRFLPQKCRKDIHIELKQLSVLNDDKQRMNLARDFQKANIFNVRATLRYYKRREGSIKIIQTVEEITSILQKIEKANDINMLMVYEAQARQKYYQCFNEIMPGEYFHFEKRTKRPPKDALNAMISFGNTLLYTRFATEIYRSKLDIRIGILHSSYKRLENLNLDLADLFKPILVDRTIFTLVNRNMINEIADFEEIDSGGVYLTHRGKRNSKVLKECRRYLRHVQKSVFEGDLTEKQLSRLKSKIATLINVEQDQVAIYKFVRSGLVEKDTIGYQIINENVI